MSNGLGTGPVSSSMGLGDMLVSQRDEETEEQKRRRMMGLDQARPVSSLMGSQYGMGPLSTIFGTR